MQTPKVQTPTIKQVRFLDQNAALDNYGKRNGELMRDIKGTLWKRVDASFQGEYLTLRYDKGGNKDVCFAIKAWMECPRHGPTCFIVLAADPVHVEHFKCKTPKERQEWLNCFQWSADYRSLERPYVCKFEHFQKEDRPFGRGRFGAVYRGKFGGCRAAIKQTAASSLREPVVLSLLHHENIVRMFAVCVHFDTMYIVMELCNFSLGQFINFYNNKSARINSKWRNKIFSDIVLGVRHLHSKQLLYCDMKPGNILLCIQGPHITAKLGDLGSCLFLNKGEREPTAHTASYSSHDNPLTRKSDVFSFGVLVWAVDLQESPNSSSLQSRKRLPLKRVSPELKKMVKTCTRADAKKRPSFRRVAGMLQDIINAENESVKNLPLSNRASD